MNELAYPFHPRLAEQEVRRTDVTYPDGRRHVPYVYSDEIVLAVNAALTIHRPLLLRGTPGCGKSTLARDVALALGRDFDEQVITSRTTATDLLWEFDAMARLSDASAAPDRVADRGCYVRRGLLWRAFQPDTDGGRSAVVLIDEIDKADPDLPNDLLVPLGEDRFVVTDTVPHTQVQRRRDVLVVITTNEERDLPPAFLRRCVALTLPDPSADPARLKEIARCHLSARHSERGQAPPPPPLDEVLLEAVVERVQALAAASAAPTRRAGTAEILDAFLACLELGIGPPDRDSAADDPRRIEWEAITRVVLYKDLGDPDAPAQVGS